MIKTIVSQSINLKFKSNIKIQDTKNFLKGKLIKDYIRLNFKRKTISKH